MNPVKKVAVLFIVFAVLGGYLSTSIVSYIQYILPKNAILVATNPSDTFIAITEVVMVFAAMLTAPFALYEVIKYLMPALYDREKYALLRFLPISIILFVGGAIFGLYVIVFVGFQFLADFSASYGITNMWNLPDLLETIMTVGVVFGLTFQLPIVMVFLTRHKIIRVEQLTAYRGAVIVAILIIAAVITPTPDAFTQIITGLPMYALYEGTIVYIKMTGRKKA